MENKKQTTQYGYLITMQTVRTDDSEEETAEFITEGSLVKKGGHYYVTLADSGIEGFPHARTTLKTAPGSVTMMRFAPMQTQMLFEPGKHYTSIYQTPAGSMAIGVWTHELLVSLTDSGGRVFIDYSVEIDEMPTVRTQMTVTVRKK